MIQFTVPGIVVPKGRPRVGKHGTYTPSKTKAYENKVRIFARMACKAPVSGPVAVRIKMYGKGRGDIDNKIKAFLDSMNDIVFNDDRQVVRLEAERFPDGEPRAEVEVEEIDP